jgi:hypothetical protein
MQVASAAGVARREWRFWIWAAGALVSAVSLISLIQHAFDVGMTPLFAEALAFYRALTHPLFDLALFWLPFRLAGSVKDLLLTMFLTWAIQMRYFWSLPRDEIRAHLLRVSAVYRVVGLAGAFAIIYLPGKLLLGTNMLSEGLGAMHPYMQVALFLVVFIAPAVGAWSAVLVARPDIAILARQGAIFYIYNLAIMCGVAALVFALNYQAS